MGVFVIISECLLASNLITDLPVRNTYSIRIQGTDRVIPVHVVTVPKVVLKDITVVLTWPSMVWKTVYEITP